MPSPFSITVPSGIISLDPAGQADVQFSITNTGSVALRGRAVVAPLDGLDAGCLSIRGEAEHDFPVQGTYQYVVAIKLPPGTAPGRRRFRLDVIGVENPDEVFTQGQAVSFENATAGPVEEQPKRGYVAAILGALVGLLAGGSSGLLIGALLAIVIAVLGGDLGSLLAGILVLGIIGVVGPWVGSSLGVRYNLRLRGYEWATLTAAVNAAAFPILAAILMLPVVLIGGTVAAFLFLLLVVPACIVVPPLAARGAVLYVKTGKF